MDASNIMSSPVFTLRDTATVGEAARLLIGENISTLPILNRDDHMIGVITHSDFFLKPILDPGAKSTYFEVLHSMVDISDVQSIPQMIGSRPIVEVMSTPVTTIEENTSVQDIVQIMRQQRRKRLPVMRAGKVVGMVCRHDFLKLVVS